MPHGVYLHIPFCASRCIYCDFHSQTDLSLRPTYVDALCREALLRAEETGGEPASTIYIGGGTPSLLTTPQLHRIFHTLQQIGGWLPDAEITLEANPDDLSPQRIAEWAYLPVNRISLGVQTFDNQRLRFLHRRHTARQAIDAVRQLQRAGYTNLSIDLIYGHPGQNLTQWADDLEQAISLNVAHLSAYALTYETGTPLHRLVERGAVEPLDDDTVADMYDLLCQRMAQAGYVHYELSNFAKTHCHSRHNTAYWTQIPYMGLGAGAHSYDGISRSWNPPLDDYLKGLPPQREQLSYDDRFNERILTRLRTAQGLNINELENDFSPTLADALLHAAQPYVTAGKLLRQGPWIRLDERAMFVSNGIIAQLMR